MNRVALFRDLIEEPAPQQAAELSAELVQPLRDLAQALTEKGVGAKVETSDGGRRHHLLLWPLHRPAHQSLGIMVEIRRGRGTVVPSDPPISFTTAEELTAWLTNLVKRQEFRDAIEDLHAQAKGPVEARLERANGMATLAHVSAKEQALFDLRLAGTQLDVDLELEDGEPLPRPADLRVLDSARIRFDIVECSVTGRTVHLTMRKRG